MIISKERKFSETKAESKRAKKNGQVFIVRLHFFQHESEIVKKVSYRKKLGKMYRDSFHNRWFLSGETYVGIDVFLKFDKFPGGLQN